MKPQLAEYTTVERLRLCRGVALTLAFASGMIGVSSLGVGIANPKSAIFDWTKVAAQGVVAYVFLPAMVATVVLAVIAVALQLLIHSIARRHPESSDNLTHRCSRRGPAARAADRWR